MQFDTIFNRARADLVLRTERGEEDVFLWEHSVRVARNAELIASFTGDNPDTPDLRALVAAALYHDAGWIARVRTGAASRADILLRPLEVGDREYAAEFMQQSLAPILRPETMAKAVVAVREHPQRDSASIEAKTLAEAEALEEFGFHALWIAIRRGVSEGKGLQSTLETWRRRREYHFWDARLNDSFRIAAVRDVAEKRLQALERFMNDLRDQCDAVDLSLERNDRSDELSLKA
jgi:HD superfamily phosphodiesterase